MSRKTDPQLAQLLQNWGARHGALVTKHPSGRWAEVLDLSWAGGRSARLVRLQGGDHWIVEVSPDRAEEVDPIGPLTRLEQLECPNLAAWFDRHARRAAAAGGGLDAEE